MKVACPHCNASYGIDDRRVPAGGANVRCPRCRGIIPVRTEGREAAVPLPAPPEAQRPSRAAVLLPPPLPPRAAMAPPSSSSAPSPMPIPVAAAPVPLPAPAATAPSDAASAAEPLGFGEVDLPASTDPGPPADELEALLDLAPKPAADAGRARAAGYKVRRRSGKIFGPFAESQLVEMLTHGELMGNEEVSSDEGATWSAIAAIAPFGEALRRISAAPTSAEPIGAGAPRAPTPRGKVPASGGPAPTRDAAELGERRSTRNKVLVPAAVLLLAIAVGASAGLTRFGFFFSKAFRRADAAKIAALLADARGALDRAEYASDRAALDAAARALVADPESPDAAAMHAMIVASLELRHGAPPGALEQARRAADRLEADAPKEIAALAARLAVSLATSPGPGTLSAETALEQAAAGAAVDPEILALLARAALARGDATRAATLYAKLEQLLPGKARARHGAGLALLARRDLSGARAVFEEIVAAEPGHLPSRLELAAIAESTGDVPAAESMLAPLLAQGAEAKLAPAERARALVLRAALLARTSASAGEAQQTYEAAVRADPRLIEARLALARHHLQRGDAAAAVRALDDIAAQAVAVPAVGAIRIRALAETGRALDASSLADQALARSPGDAALLLAKASALHAAGKDDDAMRLYRDAAARDPSACEPHLALGQIALARRDLAEARAQLAAAVERGPREPAAHVALAVLAAADGDPAGAEKGFQAALALDAQHAPAEIGLARLALARGDPAGARTRVERALAVAPRNVEAHVMRGMLLAGAKDLPGAESAFQLAVELQPRNAEALFRLGVVKLERGEDLDGAVQRLTAASNEEPGRADIREWLGRALLRKGETPAAVSQLRKAVQLDGQNPEHHVQLGAALERSGALAEAVEEYRAATAADPRFADGHERLGVLYAANGRYADAAAAYEKAIALAPRTSRLRIALADCRARLGKYDEAVRGYREVMRLDPTAVQVAYKLARALHGGEGTRAALPWYERAAREEPTNPMPHYYLGYLYKERGQRASAVAEFRRFLQLKPDADEKKDIEAEIEDLGGR